MTDEHDGERRPSRRDMVEEVGRELGQMRRDLRATSERVRDHGGLLAEAMPRVELLEHTLAELIGRVDALVDDEKDETPAAALSALGLGKPRQPVEWAVMKPAKAAEAWTALAAFTAEILCGRYRPTRGELPDCWPLHPAAVAELSWLRVTYIAAHVGKRAQPAASAEWHTRWLLGAYGNLARHIDPAECSPGYHRWDQQVRDDEGMHSVPTPGGDQRPGQLPEPPAAGAFRMDPEVEARRRRDEDARRRRVEARRADTSAGRVRTIGPVRPERSEKLRAEQARVDLWLPLLHEAAHEDLAWRRAAGSTMRPEYLVGGEGAGQT